jgi:hypothetical protein
MHFLKIALADAPILSISTRTSRSSPYARTRDIKDRNMLRRMMFRGSTSLLGKLFIGATVPTIVVEHCGEISTR